MNENVIEWLTGDNRASVTFPAGKFARRIIALHDKYPDEIDLVLNKDNSVWAKIPLEYVTIRKPKTVNLTDEQRKERAEKMKQIRQNRKKDA